MKKQKRKYAASPNGVLGDEQAPIVGAELDRIERERGCLKPTEVVDEARPKKSPLHRYFTWDDTEAAELHRQNEARALIRSVVIITVDDRATPPARAFVHVTSSAKETTFTGPAYVSTVRAMSDADYKTQVLNDALSELNSFRTRYQHLRELAEVIAAIERIAA